MARYEPSELRAFLDSLGIRPKKGLSQNFLIDGNIVRKIVAAADITAADTVLEIGPGPGAVSEAIVETGAHLIAVEKDRILAEDLKRLKNASIYNEDILEFDLEAHLKPNTKVIGNLPYHITTPIITRLAPLNQLFSDLVFMMQDEVARRMTAAPGTAEYGSITVFLNIYAEPRYAFKVSRNSFYPVPNVDSAILHLKLKTPPPIDLEAFFTLTRTAFNQRRKMLRQSLKGLITPDVFTIAKIPETARPEELSHFQFLDLFHAWKHAAL